MVCLYCLAPLGVELPHSLDIKSLIVKIFPSYDPYNPICIHFHFSLCTPLSFLGYHAIVIGWEAWEFCLPIYIDSWGPWVGWIVIEVSHGVGANYTSPQVIIWNFNHFLILLDQGGWYSFLRLRNFLGALDWGVKAHYSCLFYVGSLWCFFNGGAYLNLNHVKKKTFS